MKVGAVAIETQIWASPLKPANRSGSTPTTVNGTRLTWITRPRIDGAPPKRTFQRPCEISATFEPADPSSSGANVRPSSAETPSTGKYAAETISPASRSGSATPVRFRSSVEWAATASKDRAWRRRLSNLGYDQAKGSAGVLLSWCVIETVMRASESR